MLLWHSGRLKPREYCFCKYFLVKYVNAWKIDQESFRKRSLMLKCASLGLDKYLRALFSSSFFCHFCIVACSDAFWALVDLFQIFFGASFGPSGPLFSFFGIFERFSQFSRFHHVFGKIWSSHRHNAMFTT